ncbi:DUF5004 domain-containing protein [Fulvivirga sp. M361]|uniref:DUF5004 domain-containing protein n=1 Tax=Fulvivirga sp. M361 TaxID=2594266 RepID=UPI00117A057E|nr:DUF5004 domain-containing protein [Fulvivirga sp. M361]TRX48580.1 DUF5004 domain-containing protein [Fulvivirga sp. M361]
MKSYKNLTIVSCLLVICSLMLSCDNFVDEAADFNDIEAQTLALSKTWNADQVIFDGVDVTDQESFSDFSITFSSDNTWTAENGSPIILSNGSWNFIEGDINRVDMSGTTVIIGFSIDKTTSRVITLTFTAGGSAIGARTKGVDGEYVFRLSTLEE